MALKESEAQKVTKLQICPQVYTLNLQDGTSALFHCQIYLRFANFYLQTRNPTALQPQIILNNGLLKKNFNTNLTRAFMITGILCLTCGKRKRLKVFEGHSMLGLPRSVVSTLSFLALRAHFALYYFSLFKKLLNLARFV